MDFTKYVSMLDTGGLYFSRSDLLGDPFEASSSQVNIALRLQDYEETIEQLGVSSGAGGAENYVASYSKILEWHRQWLYVNSWHMNEYESAAMWGLYTKTDEAIAVQSRFARLRECLPSEVKYVAPIAPSWFRNLVAAVTVKYGFANTPIVSSSLAERPVY